jgi:hypothetical protein
MNLPSPTASIIVLTLRLLLNVDSLRRRSGLVIPLRLLLIVTLLRWGLVVLVLSLVGLRRGRV